MIEFESQAFHLLRYIYIKKKQKEQDETELNGKESKPNIHNTNEIRKQKRERNNLHLNYTCMFIVICIVVEFSSFKPKNKKNKIDKWSVYSKLLLMKQPNKQTNKTK